jgi:cell shape-determining protein MreC
MASRERRFSGEMCTNPTATRPIYAIIAYNQDMLKESVLAVENERLKAENEKLQLKHSEQFNRLRAEVQRLKKENDKLKSENKDLDRKYHLILRQLEKTHKER